jgi:predicted neutral ceramidase superfamily lipid hydrolase
MYSHDPRIFVCMVIEILYFLSSLFMPFIFMSVSMSLKSSHFLCSLICYVIVFFLCMCAFFSSSSSSYFPFIVLCFKCTIFITFFLCYENKEKIINSNSTPRYINLSKVHNFFGISMYGNGSGHRSWCPVL